MRVQEQTTEDEKGKDKSPSPPCAECTTSTETNGSTTPRRASGSSGAAGSRGGLHPKPPPSGRLGAQTARRPPLASPRTVNASASPKADIAPFEAPLFSDEDGGHQATSSEAASAHPPPATNKGGLITVKVNNKLVPILPMEQLISPDKFRHHPDAWTQREDIAKTLQMDPRLGYGRRVVPVQLVQHRIDSLMSVYRSNTDGALEKLQDRLKVAKQDRVVHRGPSAMQMATADAMEKASEEYLASHRSAKEVPYAVLKQARDVVQSAGETLVRGRSSPEALKHRNEERLQQQRARLLLVEEQRKDDLLKTARRHEELVEATAEQRRVEAAEQLCAVWQTRAMLFLTHKVFAKSLLQFRTHQHMVSSYTCLKDYWTMWHDPAEERAMVLRRLRLKGKLRFALCAVRLLAFHLVRKRHVATITTMLSLRLSSQRFIYAVRHLIRSVRLAQRRIRQYLAWKRARIVVLLLQWDAVERDMRNPNFSPLLGRSVVMDSSEHSMRAADHSGAHNAAKDTKPASGKDNTKKGGRASKDAGKEAIKSEDAMVNELVARDKFDAPIPFDVRAAVVKRLWTEHRKRFYNVEQAILQRVDQEEYYKAMKAYQQLTQRKQAAVVSPKAPRPRVLPLLIRRQIMIHAIQPFLDMTRALLVKAKTVAARSAVRDNLHFEYFSRRDAFTSLLHANDDALVTAFEIKSRICVPRGLQIRDEAMVAIDDRNDASSSVISSPRTLSSSANGGDVASRSKSFSHGSPTAPSPKAGDLADIVSSKSIEVLQRRFPMDEAFAILGKHIETVCRPIEQAVREMESSVMPPQAITGKGAAAAKKEPRSTARTQRSTSVVVNTAQR
jgi:hypothetical protein